MDERGREVARYQIVYGAHVLVKDGQKVKEDDVLATWDPFTFAILTEVAGTIKFQDLKEGKTVEEEVDKVTGQTRLVVKDSDEKNQPRLEIRKRQQGPEDLSDADPCQPDGRPTGKRSSPATSSRRSRVKRPRPRTSSAVCRVSSSFSKLAVRRETAVMSEIDGTVTLGPISKGKRKLIITGDDGDEREYDIPRGTHINVQDGDRVRAGEPLMDGPLNPHDILRVLGTERACRNIS